MNHFDYLKNLKIEIGCGGCGKYQTIESLSRKICWCCGEKL